MVFSKEGKSTRGLIFPSQPVRSCSVLAKLLWLLGRMSERTCVCCYSSHAELLPSLGLRLCSLGWFIFYLVAGKAGHHTSHSFCGHGFLSLYSSVESRRNLFALFFLSFDFLYMLAFLFLMYGAYTDFFQIGSFL